MLLILLLGVAIQLAATLVGFALMRRRVEGLKAEVAELREAMARQAMENEAARRAAPRMRRAVGAAVHPDAIVTAPAPAAAQRAARAWNLPKPQSGEPSLANATPTQRAMALAALALLPGLALFLGAESGAVVAAGLGFGAAMMLISLRAGWGIAAWAGVLTAGFWALAGLAATGFAATAPDPARFSAALALAAAAGLTHARSGPSAAGSSLTLLMAAAALALGVQIGIIGPAGAALGAILASAAIIGAVNLRLEALHFASFGAGLACLYVLSGQDAAAIWFSPAATWTGAIFFAIALVRTPMLGARGAGLAATGALAPAFAIVALHLSGHALGDNREAALALAALGLGQCGLLALVASRRERGIASLGLTLWVLTLGAFGVFAAAIMLAAPAPLAATAFAALSLGLLLLNVSMPSAAWRAAAVCSGVLCLVASWRGGAMLLGETPFWPSGALVSLSFAAPALVTHVAARAASQFRALATATCLQWVSLALTVAGANLAVRALFSGGAPRAEAVGFFEAGVQIAIWLGAALALGKGAVRGGMRAFAAACLSSAALAASVLSAALWLTPYWRTREAAGDLTHELAHDWAHLGFLIPALLLLGNWLMWRERGAHRLARLTLAAGALLCACFIASAIAGADDMPVWASTLLSGTVFVLAIAANFAPGITTRRSYLRRRR